MFWGEVIFGRKMPTKIELGLKKKVAEYAHNLASVFE